MTLLTLLVAGFPLADAPKWTIRTTQATPDVPEAISRHLDGSAVEVSSPTGVVAEFWFRTELPTQATAEQLTNGLTYRELPETTLLAVMRLPTPFVDFRKQTLPAGTYSLRLAFQPDTGDHTDTAPHTEFALVSRIEDETSVDTLQPKDLYKRSITATGGDHPGVLLLFPGKIGMPAAVTDRGDTIRTLEIDRPARGLAGKATVRLAVTVSGVSPKR